MQQQQEQPTLEPIEQSRLVGFELNLEKNLIFVPRTFKGRSFERTFIDETPEGLPLKRKLSVGKTRKGEEIGVLYIPSHYPLALILHELWENAGKPTDKILSHSLYELNRGRGVESSGRNREKTEHLLEDLRATPLRFEATWYIKSEKAHAKHLKPFTILDYLDIRTKEFKRNGRTVKKGLVRWRFDQHVIDSLLQNHTHPTIKTVIFSIKQFRDTAIPFYNFADRLLSQNEQPKPLSLQNFWQQATQLEPPHYKRKRDLAARAKKILGEIDGKALSSGGVLAYDIYPNTKKDGYNVKLSKKPDDADSKSKKQALLIERMVKVGFYKKDAQEHVNSFDREVIEGWLNVIPQLKAKGIKSPANYIHASLKKGDSAPEYTSTLKTKPVKDPQVVWFCTNPDCIKNKPRSMATLVRKSQYPSKCSECGSPVTS